MRYGKYVFVLLAVILLLGGYAYFRDRGSDEAPPMTPEVISTIMPPTSSPREPNPVPTVSGTQNTESGTPAAQFTPSSSPSVSTAPTVPNGTPTGVPCELQAGPTDEELARKQLLEVEFAENTRYPPEQVYSGSGADLRVIEVYRVPNDLTDLGIFLGYKVTAEQSEEFSGTPYYGTSKEIEGETFLWIWREGAVEYLKSHDAKPYWCEP